MDRGETEFADIDELGLRIQRAIDELLEEGKIARDRTGQEKQPGRLGRWLDRVAPAHPRYEGFCARSCAAYRFLAMNERTRDLSSYPGAVPKRYKPKGGESHYWMQTEDGRVLELNNGPNDRPDRKYCAYERGNGQLDVSLRREDEERPGFPKWGEAQIICDKVLAGL